jgi:hypothetical protein
MAQRKQPSQPQKKAPPAKAPTKSSAASARALSKAGTRPSGASKPQSSRGPAGRPPTRKPGKSIVNQRQTPWGLVAVVAVLVIFAGAIVAYAVTRHKDSTTSNRYRLPELAAAKAIHGVRYKQEPQHVHVTGTVKYNTSPPTGGDHSAIWADNCGTVYTHQLANENAVHMLEHGAVWITYNPKTATASDIATLKADVAGVAYLALTPYAGLKTPVSLQAWGYQLFVQKASDPRVEKFIDALRHNPKTTPELGIDCSDPYWNAKAASASTPGHPYNGG